MGGKENSAFIWDRQGTGVGGEEEEGVRVPEDEETGTSSAPSLWPAPLQNCSVIWGQRR